MIRRRTVRADGIAPAHRSARRATMVNKRTGPVRKRAAQAAPRRRPDARVVRTRQVLSSALVELMLARRFDDISVQQVLERAKVGRATFYAHFRNKHDLLLSDAERFCDFLQARFLESAQGSRRVAPVEELFAHVADYHDFQRALAESGQAQAVFALVTAHLADTIEKRLAVLAPDAGSARLSRDVMSRVFAGALVELLRWWMHRRDRPSAAEMDDQFHQIVWQGLRGVAS
jgi:AcrR family transcriptional regulator